MHADHFGPTAVIGDDGLARCVQSKIRPHLRHILYLRTSRDARPQIIIHGEVKRRVKRTDLLPQVRAEERGLLRDVDVSLPKQMLIRLRRIKFADHASAFVDEIAIAVDHARVGMFQQKFHRRAHRAYLIRVIGVNPRKDIALRARESLVDRVGLTFVWFAHPRGDSPLILFDGVHRSISRRAIHNDVLNARIILTQHGLNRRFDVARLVEGGGDDGDERER